MNGFTNFPFPETENLFISFFFISNIFISNGSLKLAKNQADAKQQPEAELLLFGNYSYSLSTLSPKNNKIDYKYLRDYMINYNENEDENENRSHRYNINRPCLDMDTYIVN